MSTPPKDDGDYVDHDLGGGDVDTGQGSYTDQQTAPEARSEEPHRQGQGDDGEYTDSDHVAEHRPNPPRGGYTSTDTSTNDVKEHPHG